MTEPIHLIVAVLIGLMAGLIFFGGLWLTTQRLTTWKSPALWLPLSFFARTAIVLGAIYWVGSGSLPRIAACLVGFLMSRATIFYATRSKHAVVPHGKEVNDATES